MSDIFFLQERAAVMSGRVSSSVLNMVYMHLQVISYTILVSSATSISPLLASFIVENSHGGWVDYMCVCTALAGANTPAIYLVYPESNFGRPADAVHQVCKYRLR